jgi:Dolichyl-phosphate-mannose-protein mannosyltransferase
MKRDAAENCGGISPIVVLSCAWPALLLATVCLLPYLNKPFLIDDPHFLMMARQILRHPTHPMDFTECWNLSSHCTKAYLLTPGNALMGYVLVPTVLGGAHEWAGHLTQLVLVWIAIVAMASLVLRLGWDRKHATVGALLLAATAPFLPMASTVMPDILATAVALIAMERLAAWKAEQKWSQGAVAGIALGLAGFARSHLALLLPLAAFFLLESSNPKEILTQVRRKFWLWIPVLFGSALLLAIIATTREHNLAIAPTSVYSGWVFAWSNLSAYLLYIVFPFPLAACWFANRWKSGRLHLAIIIILLGLAAVITLLWHPEGLRVSFLALVGLIMLVDLLWEALKQADHTYLFLMLWILIPLPIVYYGHLPSKYLLPCMPAIILLCFRLLEGFSAQFFRAAAVLMIVGGAGFSLLILRSDAEFARFGRNALYSLIQPHVAAGERVWYYGDFSAYWYAPLAGAVLTFPGGPQPKPGDLLVVGLYEGGGYWVLPRFPHRTLVGAVTHKYSFGRTMMAGVGLYTNRVGYWLWGFGTSGEDWYQLWRIESE